MTFERKGHKEAVYFIGPEVETTPAAGLKTLFVVGVRGIDQMVETALEHNCKHIYLGANRSFQKNKLWATIIPSLLNKGFKVTLDYPISAQDFVSDLLDGSIVSHPNFIPMVSCIMPHIETFSKNLMIKIDDVNFEGTNSGVWCITAHDLLDVNRFTPWNEYCHDKVVTTDEDIKKLRSYPNKGKSKQKVK